MQKHRGAHEARSGALAVKEHNSVNGKRRLLLHQIDRAIGKLWTESQAIWLARNIR